MTRAAAILAAATMAGTAGAVLSGRTASATLRLRTALPGGPTPAARPPARARSAARWAAFPATLFVLWLFGAVAVVVALAATGGCWLFVERRRGRALAARRDAVLETLTGLATELRGGAEPRTALAVAAEAAGLARVAVAARHPAADVPAVLRAAGAAPGGSLLLDLAAAWEVVAVTGGGLAGPVTRLVTGCRADDAARRELDAALAGPRATAALLSVLPLGGIAMGSALGADPTGFLLGTGAGRACLLGGAVLVAAGVWWTRAITGRALR